MSAFTHPAASLARLRDWFETEFVPGYSQPGGTLPALLELKRAHTHRVASNARLIATELAWDDEAVALGEWAGLLHDVGRFPQYQRYQTFRDYESEDHARLSWNEVLERQLLTGLDPLAARHLEWAVLHHNAKQIPATVPIDSLPFLQLIRDADKLDIFRVVDEAIRHDRRSLYPDVDVTSPPTSAMIDACRKGTLMPYHQARSLADSLLMQLLWFHDINFAPTFRLMRERGIVALIGANLVPFPEKAELLAAAEAFILIHTDPPRTL